MSSPTLCPRCGIQMTENAPEGLCPRCLLKAGLASTEVEATAPDDPNTPLSAERLGPLLPEYEVFELIGRGGMGAVYRARHLKLDRPVAIKILAPSLAADPAFAARFAREARTLANLNHPNILTIHDFGEVEGLYYLVTEFVTGENLRARMARGPISPQDALACVAQICGALQYAHHRGIVHRDIKPENILIDEQERVRLADFGLARLVDRSLDEFTLTATNQVLGTPHYMAPEQLEKPDSVDQRADIYSLGVVFYEVLTGELPIGRFAPPSERSTGVDRRVDDVVLRSLEPTPEKRYQDVGEVKTDVEQLEHASSPHRTPRSHAAPSAGGEPSRQPTDTNAARYLAFVIGGGVILVASFLAWFRSPLSELPGGFSFSDDSGMGGAITVSGHAWESTILILGFMHFPPWLVAVDGIVLGLLAALARWAKQPVPWRVFLFGTLGALVCLALFLPTLGRSMSIGYVVTVIVFVYLFRVALGIRADALDLAGRAPSNDGDRTRERRRKSRDRAKVRDAESTSDPTPPTP